MPIDEGAAAPLVVVTVRFSVLVSRQASWLIGRGKSEAEYRRDLFGDERLSLHHHLFERVTLPSLAAQVPALSEDRFRLYAITSADLPRRHALALDEVIARYPWARVRKVPPDAKDVPHGSCVAEFLGSAGDGQGHYAHVRLDDDDAVAADFVSRVEELATSGNVGKAVSLARGYAAMLDPRRRTFTSVVDYRHALAAQGLSYIGAYKDRAPVGRTANVYALGHHLKVDTKVPVILDSRSPAFLRTFHQASDTQTAGQVKFPKGKAVARPELLQRFPSMGELMSRQA